MSTNSQNIARLNALIETLKDGQAGFKTAADDVDSAELRTLFNGFVLQRSQFSAELQTLVRSLGEADPASSGTVSGTVHRGWIDMKSAITSRDEHAILAECERGEDAAVAHYREVLDSPDLPSNIREVLANQFVEIKAAHDQVRDLRDATVSR